jgi:hypothetical protein
VNDVAIGGHPPARRHIGGWGAAALLVGLVSLGLPWGTTGAPGYEGPARVLVVAAGGVAVLGLRRDSTALVRLAWSLAIGAIVVGGPGGGGPVALVVALFLLHRAGRSRSSRAGEHRS